jgi:maltose alpha-D-glucosyltransferase/alpha-amylase
MTLVPSIDPTRRSDTNDTDPFWYKDAVIYEVRVSSFFDANGDGIGDFQGLEQKLDYLEDLGVTALWLLPFYPSPLRDDGYDISDYTDVHPDLGTLEDFRRFLDAAHQRGLRVITELVINHTSDRHPWFQRARRAPPGSVERDFYVWSEDPTRLSEARIIFKDFETSNFTWDAVAKSYFWHRFYSHQPDLNFDNPHVLTALFKVMDFWLEMGVDGLRLDAIPYLVERQGTNCENLPETHDVIRRIRAHIDEHFPNRMLLAEANQWPEDTAAYFGLGDECHMAFHFPIMPRLFLALEMEDRFPLVDILNQTPEIPETCQWAIFLRNHDELTLEMVTEEEREYLWGAYASEPTARINLGIRRRLAPLLEGSRARIQLMTALLLSLPGTPVLYYGDEIAMGDNIFLGDRNGVRTPMQWSPDRNAGFSRTNPQRLLLPVVIDPEYHYEAVNVENQQGNSESLLWWVKRVLALRKQFRAFGRGRLKLLYPKNPRVLAFLRTHGDETLLVVANFSGFSQHVELDLHDYRGVRPIEVFGQSRFGTIGRRPYSLTVGPHGWYWLQLSESERRRLPVAEGTAPWPRITVESTWLEVFAQRRSELDATLAPFVQRQRWYGNKGEPLSRMAITSHFAVSKDPRDGFIAVVEASFIAKPTVQYLLPLAVSDERYTEFLATRRPDLVLAEVVTRSGTSLGLLHDASMDREFVTALFQLIQLATKRESNGCRVVGESIRRVAPATDGEAESNLDVRPMGVQQSNSSVRIGNHHILKVLRRYEDGPNPELELGRYLTTAGFEHVAKTSGAVTLHCGRSKQPATVAVLQEYVTNVGDAWAYTQGEISRYFRTALTTEFHPQWATPTSLLPLGTFDTQPEPRLRLLLGPYLDAARLLGQRTAQMHLCFASAIDLPSLAPEPFTAHYQRQLYQGFRNLALRTIYRLTESLDSLQADLRVRAERLIENEALILSQFEDIRDTPIEDVLRIRIHGDYHLGQVLCTGQDFVIVDFEGEPLRSVAERRIRRCALRDVAGMLRSFQYASRQVLHSEGPGAVLRPIDRPKLVPWADTWLHWVSTFFLEGYLATAKHTQLLPSSTAHLDLLLRTYLLEKALYEIGYELGHRPDWVGIPIEATGALVGLSPEPLA